MTGCKESEVAILSPSFPSLLPEIVLEDLARMRLSLFPLSLETSRAQGSQNKSSCLSSFAKIDGYLYVRLYLFIVGKPSMILYLIGTMYAFTSISEVIPNSSVIISSNLIKL